MVQSSHCATTGTHTLVHASPSALSAYDATRIGARAAMMLRGGLPGDAGLAAALRSTACQSWGASGMMAVDDEGDLYRATFDVYAVNASEGWQVAGAPIDARALEG